MVALEIAAPPSVSVGRWIFSSFQKIALDSQHRQMLFSSILKFLALDKAVQVMA
jgi:DNA-binding transcriptional regulator/RsmH inhibitor MraZ